MRNYYWSEEEIEYLKELAKDGLSRDAIAAKASRKFGRKVTRGSICGKLHRMGASFRTGTKAATKANGNRNKISVNSDPVTVAILTAKDDKPNETSQPILVMRDGKLHANDALSENSCRWPINDPLSKDFCFCGQDTIPLQSYCNEHFKRVYEPVRVRQTVPANDEKVMA